MSVKLGELQKHAAPRPGSRRAAALSIDRLLWTRLLCEGNEVGVYYMRGRWYDPELGRFVQEDSIGVDCGINDYAFAGNDPVNGSDPSGLDGGSGPAVTGCLQRAEAQKQFGEFAYRKALEECIGTLAGVTAPSGPPAYYNPLSISTWDWALLNFHNFVTGEGPTNQYYGPTSPQVQEIQTSPKVSDARKMACSNMRAQGEPHLDNFSARFGLSGLRQAGPNATRQFVGRFR